MSCCYRDEYDEVFTTKEAARTASRFESKGLRGTAAELAAAVREATPPGGVLLEVGGGTGDIQVALLEADPTATSINIELTDNWEAAAAGLIDARDLGARIERRIGDFVDLAGTLPTTTAVVMHRVLCCYPDWKAMLTSAVSLSPRVIGVTVPRSRWWIRLIIKLSNLALQLRRRKFRAFVHDPEAMNELMRSGGFTAGYDRSHLLWRTIVWKQTTTPLVG
jgi:magnesium-protoporphyrin O-methyltransferase